MEVGLKKLEKQAWFLWLTKYWFLFPIAGFLLLECGVFLYFGEKSYIVDSPGFTSLYLENVTEQTLQYYFKEFQPYVHQCYYTGCSHTHEPDCAVKQQVNKSISETRYHRYVTIYEELKERKK